LEVIETLYNRDMHNLMNQSLSLHISTEYAELQEMIGAQRKIDLLS